MLVRKFMILKALSTCLAASPAYALAGQAIPHAPTAPALCAPAQSGAPAQASAR